MAIRMNNLVYISMLVIGSTFIIKYTTYHLGEKPWCTINQEWNITECVYDTEVECKRCAYTSGTGGLTRDEYCVPIEQTKDK